MPRRATPAQLLDRLRKHRTGGRRDDSLRGDVERLARAVTKRQGNAGAIAAAWETAAPRLGDAAVGEVSSLSPGGVLRVRVPDAAARYVLDTWLRGGGLETIRQKSGTTIRRVRIDLASA